jgi:hypothetical protein
MCYNIVSPRMGIVCILSCAFLLNHFPFIPMSSKNSTLHRRPGAPAGNSNAFKHGFYTRRIKKRDLSGVETTDLKSLVEEIALIRVFTRRLVESCDSSADLYELAAILRILCLASSTITRILRVNYLLNGSDNNLGDEIEMAIRQVHDELRGKTASPNISNGENDHLDESFSDSFQFEKIN